MVIAGFYKKNGKTRPITKKNVLRSQLDKLEKKSVIKKSKYVKSNEVDIKTLKDKLVIEDGLKVDDDHDIILAMFDVWSRTPDDVKKVVKEIRIFEMDSNGSTLGVFDNENRTLTMYVARYLTREKYEDTFSHELAHGDFYHNLFLKNKDKLIRYANEMALLPPITFYSKTYYDEYVKLREKLNMEVAYNETPSKNKLSDEEMQIGTAELDYLNEEHSDTAMYKNSRNKNRAGLGVISKEVMEEAVKNYNELHGIT